MVAYGIAVLDGIVRYGFTLFKKAAPLEYSRLSRGVKRSGKLRHAFNVIVVIAVQPAYHPAMVDRTCATCGETKPLSEYFYRDRARARPQWQCKTCVNAYKRSWYERNRAHHVAVSEAAKRERIARNARLIRDYLTEHPCVDCGEDDPVVLEFDHVRGVKHGNVSSMVRSRSWNDILTGLEKCEVRCANCHRRRTARRQGWFAYL
jgi:hypothetical protein